jgi:transcriptional regulator with XRE-family HTH domain
MKKYYSLGRLITDYREVFGISQADLAALVDVDVRTVQRWEKDDTLVKPEKEEALVEATFLPHQLIRNLNATRPIPTYYDFSLRKYSLSDMDKDLPEARWVRERLHYPSERVRTLRPVPDLENVLQYLKYRCKERQIIRTSVLEEAVRILPGLNLFVTDESGFYSGHALVLPLKEESFLELRERRITPEELTWDDLTDYRMSSHPYFFAYSVAADCNNNIYLLQGALIRFLMEWNDKEYTWCTITDRYDSYYLHANTGLKVVWEDPEHLSPFGAPYRFVEGDFREFLAEGK